MRDVPGGGMIGAIGFRQLGHVFLGQRPLVVVQWRQLDPEVQAACLQETRQVVKTGGCSTRLDPGDRGLGRADSGRELLLGQPSSTPGFSNQLGTSHDMGIIAVLR